MFKKMNLQLFSEAKWAHGVVLKKGATAIAELTRIGDFPLDSDEIDVTHLTSPGGFEEVLQTIRRTGVLPLDGNFVPGDPGQADLYASYYSGGVEGYTVDFTGAGISAEWNFDGFVKSYATGEATVEGKLGFTAEIRITGQPSLDIDYSGNLTGLAISDPVTTLAPAFGATVYEYVADVATGVENVKFTVTGGDVLTVDGVTVTTATESGNFALGAAGSVTTFVVARKETGKIPRRYTVHVARASA